MGGPKEPKGPMKVSYESFKDELSNKDTGLFISKAILFFTSQSRYFQL